MALRREQPVEQVEQVAGNPVIEEKRQEAPPSADPVKTMRKHRLQGHENHHLDPRLKSWTNMNSRTLCSVPGADTVSGRAREDPHRRIATHEGRTPKVMLDCMFFTSDQELGVQLPVLVVYDLSTGAVMPVQLTKNASVETVAVVAQTLETRDTDVVLHADGEPATKSLVRATANARVHRTLPRHGPPHSHQSQAPVEACIQVYRGVFFGKQVGSGGGNRLSSSAETSRDCVVDPPRCLADDQVQHWTRWMLSLQEDLWQAI